jgi:hypothetical protein
MKEGREFRRFVICIVLAFFINLFFMSEFALNLYHAGFLRQNWNVSFIGYLISLALVYVVSYVLFKANPKVKR